MSRPPPLTVGPRLQRLRNRPPKLVVRIHKLPCAQVPQHYVEAVEVLALQRLCIVRGECGGCRAAAWGGVCGGRVVPRTSAPVKGGPLLGQWSSRVLASRLWGMGPPSMRRARSMCVHDGQLTRCIKHHGSCVPGESPYAVRVLWLCCGRVRHAPRERPCRRRQRITPPGTRQAVCCC